MAARKGNGPGWGGPAKGFVEKPPYDFTSMRQTLRPEQRDPVKMATRAARRLDAREKAEALYEKLFSLAMDAERQETQVSASVALLNRIEGMPMSRGELQIKRPLAELNDDELASAVDLIRSAVASTPDDDGARATQAPLGKSASTLSALSKTGTIPH